MAKNTNVTRMPDQRRTGVPVRGAGPMASLREEINHLFDRFTGRGGERSTEVMSADPWTARDPFALLDSAATGLWRDQFGQTDFSETSEDYEIQVDLPGLKRDDVEIEYADGMLTIAGERSDEREEERKGYYISERSHGMFRRSFRVPDNVDEGNIAAQFSDGVLTIRLPKTEEARRNTRRIEVG